MLLGFEAYHQAAVPRTLFCVYISEESCTAAETVRKYLWKGCRREWRDRKGRIKEWLNQEGTSRAWLVLPPWSQKVIYSRVAQRMSSQVWNICRNGDTTLSGQPDACSNALIVKCGGFIMFQWNFSLVHITIQPFLAILFHHFFTLPCQSCYTTLFTRFPSLLTRCFVPLDQLFLPVLDTQRESHNDKSWISAVGVICTTRCWHTEFGFLLLESFPITGRVEDKTNLIHCRFPWVYTGGTQTLSLVRFSRGPGWCPVWSGSCSGRMLLVVFFCMIWNKQSQDLWQDSHWVLESFSSSHFACWRESTAKQPTSIPIALEFSKAASSPSGSASCCLLWALMKPGLRVVWLFLEMQHQGGHHPLLYLLHIPCCLSSLLHLVMWKVGMEVLWTSPRGLRTEKGIYLRKGRVSEKRGVISMRDLQLRVTESWHSFYLFIKFVTVEISLRSCSPITVSFIILLRHTLRHS